MVSLLAVEVCVVAALAACLVFSARGPSTPETEPYTPPPLQAPRPPRPLSRSSPTDYTREYTSVLRGLEWKLRSVHTLRRMVIKATTQLEARPSTSRVRCDSVTKSLDLDIDLPGSAPAVNKNTFSKFGDILTKLARSACAQDGTVSPADLARALRDSLRTAENDSNFTAEFPPNPFLA